MVARLTLACRIHEMNTDSCLRAFLPYHEAPQFPRMLAILRLEQSSPYYYLLHPLQKSPQPLSRELLIRYMTVQKDPSLAMLRDVLAMLPAAAQSSHRTLLNFWSATLVEYIERIRQGGIPDAVVKVLVEGLVTALNVTKSGSDYPTAIYPAVLILVRSVRLAPEPFSVLLDSLAVNQDVNIAHRLITLMIMLDNAPEERVELHGWDSVLEADQSNAAALTGGVVRKFALRSALERFLTWASTRPQLNQLVFALTKDAEGLSSSCVASIVSELARQGSDEAQAIVLALRERHPDAVASALSSKKARKRKVANDSMEWTAESPYISAVSADASARAAGVRALLAEEPSAAAKDVLLARLVDTDVEVLEAIYSAPFHQLVSVDEYLALMDRHLRSPFAKRETTLFHVAYLLELDDARVIRMLLPHLFFTKSRRLTVASIWKLLEKKESRDELISALVSANTKAMAADESGATSNRLIAEMLAKHAPGTPLQDLLLDGLRADEDIVRHVAAMSIALMKPDERIWMSVLDFARGELASGSFDDELAQRIFAKPNADKTVAQVKSALLSALCETPLPSTSVHLSPEPSNRLHLAIYTAALQPMPSELSEKLLSLIFRSLQGDALVFLANHWTTSSSASIRQVALRHARSLMAASRLTGAFATDFQTLLPAIVFALGDDNAEVRDAATILIKIWSEAVSDNPSSIYRSDDIYPQHSDWAKLLLPKDLRSYLQALASDSSALVADPQAINAFQSRYLGADGKTSTRKAVLSCLITHALAWDHAASITLMEGLRQVHDSAKLESAESFLCNACRSASVTPTVRAAFKLVEPATVRRWARDGSELLQSMITALRLNTDLSAVVADRLAAIYTHLSPQQQVDVCLAACASDKELLRSCKLDVAGLIAVLDHLATEIAPETEQQSKRIRTDGEPTATDAVSSLVNLLGSQDFTRLAPEPEFIAAGVRVLSAIASRSNDSSKTDHVEQALLSAMTTVLLRIKSTQQLAAHQAGMDVIVKTIRGTTNPRTAQEALLFTAALARHSPDTVLHYVMPIFTYMGSSDFQRDDAYTFGVVEKTIESIVPVLVRSIRDRSKSTLDMLLLAKPMLSIFTDMAKRLPKHRTHSFFVHLVSTLGPEDFLAPTQLLLLSQKKADHSRLIAGLATSYGTGVAWRSILTCMEEVDRLETQDSSILEEPGLVDSILRMVRANVKEVSAKQADMPLLQDVIRLTVKLLRQPNRDTKSGRNRSKALTSLLNDTLTKLSVSSFMDLATDLLNNSDAEVVALGLAMLAERLPLVQSQVRVHQSNVLRGIIASITRQLRAEPVGLIPLRLRALAVIANVHVSDEDAALAAAVPDLLQLSKELPTLQLLAKLTPRLATRLIPHIKTTFDVCLQAEGPLVEAAIDVLVANINALHSFITKEQISRTIQTVLDRQASTTNHSYDALLQAITKKVPTKTLLPIVQQLWASRQGPKWMAAFYRMLGRTIRHSDRGALAVLVKNTMSIVLETFEADAPLVHSQAINVFLDLTEKLSENAFKPLFSRIYDWSFIDDASEQRQVMFFKLLAGLISRFKAIIIPYMNTAAQVTLELLATFAASSTWNKTLWTAIQEALRVSLELDEDAFWTNDNYNRFIPPMVAQIEALARQHDSALNDTFAATMAAMARSTSSETTLKMLNNSLLMVTRSDDAQARLIALQVLDRIWEKQEEMVQFVPETVGEFVSELLEDEDASVEEAARRLLKRIEGYVGDLSAYLE